MRSQLIRKDIDAGIDWGQERRGWQDDVVGWHHQLSGYEFEPTLGNSEGKGHLVCCSPWGRKSWTWLSDWTTEQTLTWNPSDPRGHMYLLNHFVLLSDFWPSSWRCCLWLALGQPSRCLGARSVHSVIPKGPGHWHAQSSTNFTREVVTQMHSEALGSLWRSQAG